PGLREIRAHIAVPPKTDAGEFSVAIERELTAQPHVAAVVIGEERLGARRDPLHRPSQHPGGQQRSAVFDVGVRAYAKAAADITRVWPELRLRQPEDCGKARQDV